MCNISFIDPKGAVLLGDSAYPLTEWLLTPFLGDPQGAKGRYNRSQTSTRNVIERAFGVLKKRFLSLGSGFIIITYTYIEFVTYIEGRLLQ
jgi:hypothetical protein